jgi:hypothetical protein
MNVLNSRGGYQKKLGWIGAAIFTSPKRNENRKKTIVRKLIFTSLKRNKNSKRPTTPPETLGEFPKIFTSQQQQI